MSVVGGLNLARARFSFPRNTMARCKPFSLRFAAALLRALVGLAPAGASAAVRADFTGPLPSGPATTCLKVRKTGRLKARERA